MIPEQMAVRDLQQVRLIMWLVSSNRNIRSHKDIAKQLHLPPEAITSLLTDFPSFDFPVRLLLSDNERKQR
jgi:hypothetical protein